MQAAMPALWAIGKRLGMKIIKIMAEPKPVSPCTSPANTAGSINSKIISKSPSTSFPSKLKLVYRFQLSTPSEIHAQ